MRNFLWFCIMKRNPPIITTTLFGEEGNTIGGEHNEVSSAVDLFVGRGHCRYVVVVCC